MQVPKPVNVTTAPPSEQPEEDASRLKLTDPPGAVALMVYVLPTVGAEGGCEVNVIV
jgi:hypothetical protein